MIEAPRKEQLKFLSDLRKAASHYEVYRPEIRKTATEKPAAKTTIPTVEKMFERVQEKFQGWPLTGGSRVVPEGFHKHELKKEVRKELEKQAKKRGKKRGSK